MRLIRTKEGSSEKTLEQMRQWIAEADYVVIGAGAGLSTAAGMTYSGKRFDRYFDDFEKKYHFSDMYTGGFYPYETLEEYWGFWARNIYVNRYMDASKPTYERLLDLVKDKDYFVLTTNVDHCFQKAGFDKDRLFYTQGDYGLFQCEDPCHERTYDNREVVLKMLESQGLEITKDGDLKKTDHTRCTIDPDLIPKCPVCGRNMTMNLRSDQTFVEDEGWHAAAARYDAFMKKAKGKRVLFIELGVGFNTPGIIKYPFWQVLAKNKKAKLITIDVNETIFPKELEKRILPISADIDGVLRDLIDR